MLRASAIFIVICMALIAASVSAVLYLLFGLKAAESMVVGVAVLTGLAMHNTLATRLRDRADLGGQIADLSRGTADLAREVTEIARGMALLEEQADKAVDTAVEKARAATEPITTELGELGTLVKQLAETVALHELKFAGHGLREAGAPSADGQAAGTVAAPAAAAAFDTKQARMTAAVQAALDADRVDLYLQPIVSLPQRKVRYYEAFTWLRDENGATLRPSEFLEAAEAAGLMPRIDQIMLTRSAQVVRRLQLKNRDIGLFCNISVSTLNDPQLFPEILNFLEADAALAPAIIPEFRQHVFRTAGPLETEALAALRDLGFRFCMDHVQDLRMDPREFGERGIRYVKVPAAFLLAEQASAGSDIHAADLSDLLGRFGISLVAERIETEAQVVDLLEYDVRFGQGFLFSQPRPVRAEALQRGAEPAMPAGGAGKAARRSAGASGFSL